MTAGEIRLLEEGVPGEVRILEEGDRVLHAPPPLAWLCFHCGETFTESKAAEDHFGRSEYSKPACQIDAAEFREMEERMRRYNDEDSDMHRQIGGMQSDHAIALQREEEKGYARGLRDAMREEAKGYARGLLAAARLLDPELPAWWATEAGQCQRQAQCQCGGDTPRVREACASWRPRRGPR